MKNKEYYSEEMEKTYEEKKKALQHQKYFTAGSVVLMFLVLLAMFIVLK